MRPFLTILSAWLMCVVVVLAATGPLLTDGADPTQERDLEDERDLESERDLEETDRDSPDNDDAWLSSWSLSRVRSSVGLRARADDARLDPGFAWIPLRPPAPAHV